MNRRTPLAVVAAVAVFLAVQVGALALVLPFDSAGYQFAPDPQNPANSVLYLLGILLATALMLAAFRFGVDGVVKAFVVLSVTFLSYYVLSVLVPPVATVGGYNVLAVGVAVALSAALVRYPEWYVVDATGVLVGMGGAALFGISFGILPAIILLVALAVYDAISVYGTEHMLTLASGVMDLHLPVVLVIPLTTDYSFLEATAAADDDEADDGEADDGEADDADDADADDTDAEDADPEPATDDEGPIARDGPAPEERDAFYIGLGDAVMPTILVASAAFFVTDVPTVLGVGVPALTALVGTLAGLVVLVLMVMRGRAHAGLPLLNGGSILGYLLGALAVGIPIVDALGLAPYL